MEIERNVKDFVNAAIGVVKKVKEETERQYNDLKTAGETADDDTSQKIKNSVDDALKATQDYQTNLKSISEQLESQVQDILSKLNPSSATEEIQKRLDELNNMASELVNNVTGQGTQSKSSSGASSASKTTSSANKSSGSTS